MKASERNSLPAADFGMPKERKFPMPDKAHAGNAKARASEMANKGRISKGTEAKIDAKADGILGDRGARGHHNIVNRRTHFNKLKHS